MYLTSFSQHQTDISQYQPNIGWLYTPPSLPVRSARHTPRPPVFRKQQPPTFITHSPYKIYGDDCTSVDTGKRLLTSSPHCVRGLARPTPHAMRSRRAPRAPEGPPCKIRHLPLDYPCNSGVNRQYQRGNTSWAPKAPARAAVAGGAGPGVSSLHPSL